MDANEDLNNYNRLQLKLIESKVYSIIDKNRNPWNLVFRYLNSLSTSWSNSQENHKFVGHKLRFCAFFLKTVQKLGIVTESLTEIADTAMYNYIKYLIKENETNNVIYLFSQISHDELKIKGIANFLAQIEVYLDFYNYSNNH